MSCFSPRRPPRASRFLVYLFRSGGVCGAVAAWGVSVDSDEHSRCLPETSLLQRCLCVLFGALEKVVNMAVFFFDVRAGSAALSLPLSWVKLWVSVRRLCWFDSLYRMCIRMISLLKLVCLLCMGDFFLTVSWGRRVQACILIYLVAGLALVGRTHFPCWRQCLAATLLCSLTECEWQAPLRMWCCMFGGRDKY